jgi:hopanoid biosynthesis associated RND transporter like protein HpnN
MLPRLDFDSDPLHTKDPNTEAVRTLYDLMDDPITNPYTIDVLAGSSAKAAELAQRLKTLPLVEDVMWLGSFVPENQAEKLPLLEDAAGVLRTTLSPGPPPPPDAPALRTELQKTAQAFAAIRAKLPPSSPVLPLIGDLEQLAKSPDPVLMEAGKALTRFLPLQLDRLRAALEAAPVTEADIPPEIRRDWALPDGRAKVQVLPKREARTGDNLRTFVDQVESIAPDAAGAAVTITGSADTITAAFRTAAILAMAASALLLGTVMRQLLDTMLVLIPLVVSSLLTVLLAVLLPLPLNFANIIALPLLLGVGVSFNVYFVMNWRARRMGPLGSATARAVLFSALTTATAFGSLALSKHPGTASMGRLLLLSLGCTLLTTMIFLPALLEWLGNPALALKSKRWRQMRAARR